MQRAAWSLATMLAVATPAAAQPGIGNDTCEVTFIHAPDDVRLAIERWVAAEPRCIGRIELRVIPTDDGYYLIARRPDGRIHERLVPDIDAAGVLVASWVADAWTSEAVSPLESSVVVPRAAQNERVVEQALAPSRHSRWLSVSAMSDLTGWSGGGVRAELDIARAHWLVFGAAASFTSHMPGYADESEAVIPLYFASASLRIVPYVAASMTRRDWALRFSLGYGLQISQTGQLPSMLWSQSSASLSGETSLTVSHRVGRNWAVSTGLLFWFTEQYFDDLASYGQEYVSFGSLMWMGGVRRQI